MSKTRSATENLKRRIGEDQELKQMVPDPQTQSGPTGDKAESRRSIFARNEALRKAGATVRGRRRYSEKDLLENLLSVWRHCGGMPSTEDMDRPPSRISYSSYYTRWHTWESAMVAFQEYLRSEPTISGEFRSSVKIAVRTYKNRRRCRRRRTKDHVLSEIRRVCEMNGGRAVSMRVFEEQTGIGHSAVRRHLGDWCHALEAAGVPLGPWQKMYSDDELYENLLAVWYHYGEQPTIPQINNPPSRIIESQYRIRWGNWMKSIAAFLERIESDPAISPEKRELIQEGRRAAGRPRIYKTPQEKSRRLRLQEMHERSRGEQ